MNYKYKMVQVPPVIKVKPQEHQGGEAAVYMEDIVNRQASDGWEFYRVDSIGIRIEPGCLDAFLGKKAQTLEYYVITFRKER